MAIMKSLNGNTVCDAVARGMTAVTASGSNNAYTATVDGATLTSGFNIVITPNVTSTSTAPTLNVNSTGAYPIRQRISSSAGGTTALSSANMIMANKPVRVMYIANGMGSGNHCWVIDDMVKTDATYVTGILPIDNGGTGCDSLSDLKTALGFASDTGLVPVGAGGTGASTAAQARSNLGITLANLGAAASSHEHSAANITSGTLSVARGGTGKDTHTSNAVLTGNGTSAVKNVATASGALYATSANGAPQFGTLPVAQGGTGATDAAGARSNLGAAASSHEHSAANITSGTLSVARGGTGATAKGQTLLNNLGISWGTSVPAATDSSKAGTIYIRYSS